MTSQPIEMHALSAHTSTNMPAQPDSHVADMNNEDQSTVSTDNPPRTGKIDSFTRFKEFPFEIRSKIWKFAVDVPRVVIISEAIFSSMHRGINDGTDFFIQTAKNGQPALLSVCAESRRECLPLYQLIGGELVCTGDDPRKVALHNPGIYFNPVSDTLYQSRLFFKENEKIMLRMYHCCHWIHPCNREFRGADGEDLPFHRSLSSIALDVADLNICPLNTAAFYQESPDTLSRSMLRKLLQKYQGLQEILLVMAPVKPLGSIGGPYELVEEGAVKEGEWNMIHDLRLAFNAVFRQVERKTDEKAHQKYLEGGFGTLDMSKGEAAMEAFRKYQVAAVSYKRPVLKFTGLTEGGVML